MDWVAHAATTTTTQWAHTRIQLVGARFLSHVGFYVHQTCIVRMPGAVPSHIQLKPVQFLFIDLLESDTNITFPQNISLIVILDQYDSGEILPGTN